MEDEVEHPVSRILYRQSSLEIPLTPSVPSDSDSDDDFQITKPQIVGYTMKDNFSIHNVTSTPPQDIKDASLHPENLQPEENIPKKNSDEFTGSNNCEYF